MCDRGQRKSIEAHNLISRLNAQFLCNRTVIDRRDEMAHTVLDATTQTKAETMLRMRPLQEHGLCHLLAFSSHFRFRDSVMHLEKRTL